MTLKILVLVTVTLTSMAANAGNIVSKDRFQVRMIRVTQNQDATITFEQCHKVAPDRTEVTGCSLLGSQQKYSLEELRSRRNWLYAKGVGIGALDVGLVAIATYGGVFVGGVAAAPFTAKAGFDGLAVWLGGGMVVGGVAGATGGTYAVTVIDTLNPAVRFRGASHLKKILVNPSGDAVVEDIDKVVRALEAALQ
jgi:hypothetical protein